MMVAHQWLITLFGSLKEMQHSKFGIIALPLGRMWLAWNQAQHTDLKFNQEMLLDYQISQMNCPLQLMQRTVPLLRSFGRTPLAKWLVRSVLDILPNKTRWSLMTLNLKEQSFLPLIALTAMEKAGIINISQLIAGWLVIRLVWLFKVIGLAAVRMCQMWLPPFSSFIR